MRVRGRQPQQVREDIPLRCRAKAPGERTHQPTVMAHDGLPQRVVHQDLLVVQLQQLADTAVQGALGSLAELALAGDPQDRDAAVAPEAQAGPRLRDLGVGQALQRKSVISGAPRAAPSHAPAKGARSYCT